MNGNYIKNKLLFRLGICAVLLGLVNPSALARQRKPTTAEIKQTKTELPQHMRSSDVRKNRLKSLSNKDEMEAREKLVNAWKQVDPQIANFLGSWIDYETIWSVYPSTTKGQACLVRRELNTAVLDVGRVKDGKIYLRSGWIMSLKNNSLAVTSPSFNTLLNIFGTLEEPSKLKYVDSSYLTPLLREYKQAGCTAALPQKSINNAAAKNLIQNLPDGNYTYGEIPEPGIIRNNYLAFRKSGDMVTGMSYYPHSGGFPCFQGTAQGNNIINATVITPVMGEPGKDDIIDRNQSFDLNNYYRIDSQAKKDVSSINHCIRTIISDVPQKQLSLVSNRYKQPSPNIEIPDIVKLKTMAFVKGEKEFYALKHTDNSGKCVGINRKINKLVSIHCNRANFFMWNLIPIKFSDSGKLGYVINLRGTHNCLSKEYSITSCNNLGQLVANSLNL